MKKFLIIITACMTMHATAQIKQATLQASGLTCAMCSNAINKALQKLPFADKVQSNISESSFTISFKNNQAINFDAIRKAVEGAGFSVSKLLIKGDFSGLNVTNDTHVAWQGENLHFLDVQKQVLSGEQTFQIVDKKFVTDKVYKKYAATTKMKCVQTGMMESCCVKDSKSAGSRIYHVTI